MWVSSHQMLINGKSEEISQEDLFAVAKQAGIKKAEAVAGMEQVRDAISKWSGFADEAELSRNRTGLIQSQFKW